jgi:uncharacterized protein (DUF362 family)
MVLWMSLVSLVKVRNNTKSSQQSIQESLNLIQFRFDGKANKIVIKPNLCYYWDSSTGETTDQKLVGALIDIIRENTNENVDISIVESDASAMRCKYAFRMLGYEKMAGDKKVKLVNLTNDSVQNTNVTVRNRSFRLSVPRCIAEADLFINVPKMKYMAGTKFSGALKNIFGCNPYPKKYRYHKWLDEVIVGLNKIMRPDLCVMDGLVVRGMHPQKLGLLMSSADPVALDVSAARIVGFNPHSIRHISLASSEGIGSLKCVNVGEDLSQFAKLFPKKDAKYKTLEFIAKTYSRLMTRLD